MSFQICYKKLYYSCYYNWINKKILINFQKRLTFSGPPSLNTFVSSFFCRSLCHIKVPWTSATGVRGTRPVTAPGSLLWTSTRRLPKSGRSTRICSSKAGRSWWQSLAPSTTTGRLVCWSSSTPLYLPLLQHLLFLIEKWIVTIPSTIWPRSKPFPNSFTHTVQAVEAMFTMSSCRKSIYKHILKSNQRGKYSMQQIQSIGTILSLFCCCKTQHLNP